MKCSTISVTQTPNDESSVRIAIVALAAVSLLAPGGSGMQANAARMGCPPHALRWNQALRWEGEWVYVRGRVIRARYARAAPGRPTFLDLGHAYPNPQRLTIIIWGKSRRNFPFPPEFFEKQTICVGGWVELYGRVPQIEVSDYTLGVLI